MGNDQYGTGSDGDVQAGGALSYVDNGDGTITDLNTGLMWEKKDDSGGIHDKDNDYDWSTGTNDMDGDITTTFLATLNAGGGFAGYTDWRIPNLRELQSIIDYGRHDYAVDPVFHRPATCTGCTDVTLASCSCTDEYYVSSTSTAWGAMNGPISISVWYVQFESGEIGFQSKNYGGRVRAVRGGL